MNIDAVYVAGYVRPYPLEKSFIVRGEPQDSVLASVLFLLFVDNLPACITSSKLSFI